MRGSGVLCLAVIAAQLAFAGSAGAQSSRDAAGGVTVFAAASLGTALDDVVRAWRAQGGTPVVVSYAASSTLAKQIEQGAPADLFISADEDWMDYLAARNLIRADTRRDLLGNSLVLVAERRSPIPPLILGPGTDLTAVLNGGRIAMADVNAVPAGKYGRTALESLGLWHSVRDRVAQAENVRAALLLVARGEAPLGIVYATDAAAEPNVRVVATFPESSHPPVRYPMALTARARSPGADSFAAFVGSDAARLLFEKQGFAVLN
ncbi:MAG: molybdate ABC transporter substrate-binding protein [Gemmatimonas sp.]